MEHFFGLVTLILGVAMVVIGLPKQILKQHRERRVGVTTILVFLPLGVYVSRSIYALLIDSYYIAIPDVIGIIFSSTLMYQALVQPRLKMLERLGIN